MAGDLDLRALIDIEALQRLTDDLYTATGIPSAIITQAGEVLTGSGWQRICTQFHRRHPQLERDCIASDVAIRKRLDENEDFVIYECPRGLVDASSPLIIDGVHVANVFAGQLFTTPPNAERERVFRETARSYGLDEEDYLAAMRAVPILPDARFRPALRFLARLARLVAETGLARKREVAAVQELRQAQKMESLGTLAGGVAHDFNNILGAIIGSTELTLAKLPSEGEGVQNLRDVLTACDRAKSLVQQILTFSRGGDEARQSVAVSAIAREVVALLRSTLPKTIALTAELESDASVVLADPTHVHQVLMNLCTNASQALRESGGSLRVQVSTIEVGPDEAALVANLRPGRYVKLVVADSGCGMDAATQARVFEPYFTTKGVGGGTGLGLAVVHGIVKNAGGAIDVQSAPGHGSTFTVFLPAHQPAAMVGPARLGATAAPLLGEGQQILFVDDEPMLAHLGQRLLESLGYRAVALTDAREALRLIAADPARFAVVVTDQTMPGMTGVEFVRDALALRADLPLILCTGYSDVVDEESALRLGVRAYMQKPLDRAALGAVVHRVLAGRS